MLLLLLLLLLFQCVGLLLCRFQFQYDRTEPLLARAERRFKTQRSFELFRFFLLFLLMLRLT